MEVGATGSPGTRAPKLVEEESNSERANALILPRLMEADNAMDHLPSHVTVTRNSAQVNQ